MGVTLSVSVTVRTGAVNARLLTSNTEAPIAEVWGQHWTFKGARDYPLTKGQSDMSTEEKIEYATRLVAACTGLVPDRVTLIKSGLGPMGHTLTIGIALALPGPYEPLPALDPDVVYEERDIPAQGTAGAMWRLRFVLDGAERPSIVEMARILGATGAGRRRDGLAQYYLAGMLHTSRDMIDIAKVDHAMLAEGRFVNGVAEGPWSYRAPDMPEAKVARIDFRGGAPWLASLSDQSPIAERMARERGSLLVAAHQARRRRRPTTPMGSGSGRSRMRA